MNTATIAMTSTVESSRRTMKASMSAAYHSSVADLAISKLGNAPFCGGKASARPHVFSTFQNGTWAGIGMKPLTLARRATGGAHWPSSAIGT